MKRINPMLKWLPFMLPLSFIVAFAVIKVPTNLNFTLPDQAFIQSFQTSFISIILEAIPFVLVGAILSSLLQMFVSDETFKRWMPSHPLVGILFASLLGILFPICECGMIPLIRRLIHKGMPLYIAITFIISGPIINPVVYAATYIAFKLHPEFLYARMGLAFLCAIVIGLMIHATVRSNPLKASILRFSMDQNESDQHKGNKLTTLFVHTSDEFFEMGKFLIIGSILTSFIQTLVSNETLSNIGGGTLGSYAFMMGFAFILSLCSTSDAFVAATFLHTFAPGPLLAFLVFGPMLDFKNALMLLSVFKTRFVLYLSFLIISIVFVGAVVFDKFFL